MNKIFEIGMIIALIGVATITVGIGFELSKRMGIIFTIFVVVFEVIMIFEYFKT